jgi:hypothetical protein
LGVAGGHVTEALNNDGPIAAAMMLNEIQIVSIYGESWLPW